jgi:hypothetical protein
MNLKEAFTEMVNEVSRLTGKVFGPDMSEAEVLADVQNIPSFAEQNASFENRLTEMQSAIEAVNLKLSEIQPGVSPEQMNDAIQLAVKNSVEPLKQKFATEIADLKATAEAYTKPAGEKLDVTIEASQQTEKTEPVQKKMKVFGKEVNVNV